MSSKKIILAAVAAMTLAGGAAANAEPWHHGRYHGPVHHRPYVERVRIVDSLRFHHYRVIGDPYWAHGRYVVRTYNRFGRTVFVQVDPYSGAFVREVIL